MTDFTQPPPEDDAALADMMRQFERDPEYIAWLEQLDADHENE